MSTVVSRVISITGGIIDCIPTFDDSLNRLFVQAIFIIAICRGITLVFYNLRQPPVALTIPSSERPWRKIDILCVNLPASERSPKNLIGMKDPLIEALTAIRERVKTTHRVAPIVISRLFRGGKTTTIREIFRTLSKFPDEFYPIIVSTNGTFACRENESQRAALVRLIAYALTEGHKSTDNINAFYCDEVQLLNRLVQINNSQRSVVLLIDELNKLSVPIDRDASSLLTAQFLDFKGRYLIFSSHVPFHVDSASTSVMAKSDTGRTMHCLSMPECFDKNELQRDLHEGITNLQITLALGMPSFLFLMHCSGGDEMSFAERFEVVMERITGGPKKSAPRNKYLKDNRDLLLQKFLCSLIDGNFAVEPFQCFGTITRTQYPNLIRFPVDYIALILDFLKESDGLSLVHNLKNSATTTESGVDWELVVTFGLYIRSLFAKHCKEEAIEVSKGGPFGIADDDVDNVAVECLPDTCKSVNSAVNHMVNSLNSKKPKTIVIFRPVYAKFPVFDGFVCYTRVKVNRAIKRVNKIHGFQCKLTRGYPDSDISNPNISAGWFLRGGHTVTTPQQGKWRFPKLEKIQNDILGYGLNVLHLH